MRVLSLFDGMACGRLALHRAGIPVTQYIASEIDKYAIQVARANWSDIIHLGDVREVRKLVELGVFGKIDLLIGGSPCQGFSFGGKGLAFNDPRSALFFEYVAILNALRKQNPDIKFLLENVKMKKEWLAVIDEHLGVKSVVINSALVSAQNRVRHYWCNWPVSQPADRGIYLRDIIETGEVDREKSYCIDANYYKGGSLNNYLEKSRRQNNLSPEKLVNVNPSGNGMNGWVYGVDAKSPTLTTNKGEGNKIGEITGGRVVGRKINPETGKRDDYSDSLTAQQRLELREDGKAGCITIVGKDSVLVLAGHTGEGCDMNGRVYSPEGKSPTLITNPAGGNRPPLVGQDSITYRKLTPIECERLQTVPDNYTASVSNTQRYRMLGNGWTIEVIAHIFREMPL